MKILKKLAAYVLKDELYFLQNQNAKLSNQVREKGTKLEQCKRRLKRLKKEG